MLYTAQNQAQFESLETYLDALRQAPLTQGVIRDARRALHDLSATASHRIPFQDALAEAGIRAEGECLPGSVAATAAHKHMTVLHYDGHFDVLSKVLGFENRWVAPPDSL